MSEDEILDRAGLEDRRAAALAAIAAASAGLIELAQFVREGSEKPRPFVVFETIENMADALKLTVEANGGAWDERENQLLGALERFLEGWA